MEVEAEEAAEREEEAAAAAAATAAASGGAAALASGAGAGAGADEPPRSSRWLVLGSVVGTMKKRLNDVRKKRSGGGGGGLETIAEPADYIPEQVNPVSRASMAMAARSSKLQSSQTHSGASPLARTAAADGADDAAAGAGPAIEGAGAGAGSADGADDDGGTAGDDDPGLVSDNSVAHTLPTYRESARGC